MGSVKHVMKWATTGLWGKGAKATLKNETTVSRIGDQEESAGHRGWQARLVGVGEGTQPAEVRVVQEQVALRLLPVPPRAPDLR